jgi:hypothetical protein
VRKREEKRIDAAHMGFLRSLLGQIYKTKCHTKKYEIWKQHVNRMQDSRLPRLAEERERAVGRPRSRWQNVLKLVNIGTLGRRRRIPSRN